MTETPITDRIKKFQGRLGAVAEKVASGEMNASSMEGAIKKLYSSSMETLDTGNEGDTILFNSSVDAVVGSIYAKADRLSTILGENEDLPLHLQDIEGLGKARTEFLGAVQGVGARVLHNGLETLVAENGIELSSEVQKALKNQNIFYG